MLALGIDIGTSGVRTSVLDGDSVIATARADHLAQAPNRTDARKWWRAVDTCLRLQMQALKDAGRDPDEIGGIAVDGTSGSMVLTDTALTPVSPALMYNSKGFDDEARQIASHVSGDHITRGSNSALARAMRLVSRADTRPTHLLHQADYITAKLTGTGGHSDYNNALKTGFDPEELAWPSWIGEVLDPALLPQVHAPGAPIGRLSDHLAQDYGLITRPNIHAGTTDSVAAFLAAAPLNRGAAVTSLGSTLAVKLLSDQRIDDPAIGLYSHRLGDLWLVGGASNTGGAVLNAYFDRRQLADLSAQMDITKPTGLDYYPLLEPGERFPINDARLQPRLDPRPESDVEFLQGMLESMARIEAECYRAMAARGAGYPTHVFTAGGGAQNSVWSALRAIALGVTPSPAQFTEASVGVAKLI